MERNPKYFHPARTQPFLITFFQAVMAFKRICKMMRMRVGRKRMFNLHKRSTTFQLELMRSHRLICSARKGNPVINVDIMSSPKFSTIPKVDEDFYRKQSLQLTKSERLFREVSKHIETYLSAERIAAIKHSETLEEKLSKIADNDSSKKKFLVTKRINSAKLVDNNALTAQNLFQSILHSNPATVVEPMQSSTIDEPDGKALSNIEQGEYLEGTAIYYGSSVAVQARHGGFLSYNSGEVKASAHKILSNSRFIVKKSDDLTDIGLIKYGDALWLQAGPGFVLGAQYGTLVDQKREIQPALVSCKRQSMFKAQQYGRWIILNQEQPMKTLGRPVCHLDRIILEQEWYFLASQSPYESSMYKSISNSDDAMITKIDLFQPNEECTWKIHLVALPTDDRDDLKQRQQLLQEAKDQITKSQESRYTKSTKLLSSLSESLSPELKDSNLLNSVLKHKVSNAAEQEHLFQKYKALQLNGFEKFVSSPQFLRRIYGNNSSIPMYFEKVMNKSHFNSSIDNTISMNERESHVTVSELENEYWDCAQKLLVRTESWMELPAVMNEFHERDRNRKVQAAQVLQGFMRKNVKKIFSFPRAMKKIDQRAKQKLEKKDLVRQQILLENSGAQFNTNAHPMSGISHTLAFGNQEQLAKRSKYVVGEKGKDSTVETKVKLNAKRSRDKDSNVCRVSSEVVQREVEQLMSSFQHPSARKVEGSYPLVSAKERPHSAPYPKNLIDWRNKLSRTENCDYGLPGDVFESLPEHNTLKVGVKFLKSISLKTCDLSEVKVLKK